MRTDALLLRLRMVVVAVALLLFAVAAAAVTAGVLFGYYLLLAGVLVALGTFGVVLLVVALPVSVSLSGLPVVPALLAATVGLAALSTVVRLAVLFVPGLRREFRGEGAVLAGLDARLADDPMLTETATRVAQQFDLPTPDLRVVETTTPEALTVGYRPASTTLVVSTGLLDALDAAELEAVVAHELAHVRNRDAAVMTAATLPLAFANNAVREGRGIDWEAVNERLGPGEGVDPYYLWKASFALYLLLYPVAFVGRVLAAALSRARESVADRAAARATGSPSTMAAALATLDDRAANAPDADLRHGSAEATLSILPLRDHERPGYFPWLRRWLLRNVYPTHPPTEERIRQLRELADASR